jgi:Lar family restriction alleviation protein
MSEPYPGIPAGILDEDLEEYMSEKKLKPCPFCGESEPDTTNKDGEIAIRCEYCGAYGPWADNLADAIAAWNRRAK